MNSTLTLHCLQKIESMKIKNIYDVLPSNLYYSYVDYLCSKNFTTWKNKMKMVNLEAKLEDMEVEYGGERYTAYRYDGDKGAPPQQTKITLSFQEIEIITKEAAKVGY